MSHLEASIHVETVHNSASRGHYQCFKRHSNPWPQTWSKAILVLDPRDLCDYGHVLYFFVEKSKKQSHACFCCTLINNDAPVITKSTWMKLAVLASSSSGWVQRKETCSTLRKVPNIFISIESLPLSIALSVIEFVLLEAHLAHHCVWQPLTNFANTTQISYIIIIVIKSLDIQSSKSL